MVKRVIAFGSFDVIHPGHLEYLKRAKALGDELIVVIARDESIKKLKGREPIMGQEARKKIVAALRYVDKAVIGNKIRTADDRYAIFIKLRPNLIAFGYDQKVNRKAVETWLKAHGIAAKVVRIRTYVNKDVFKSTKIKRKLAKFYC